jgi:hypothetical protein
MLRTYYTYRIRVANGRRVQIEKRDSQQQFLGETLWSFSLPRTIVETHSAVAACEGARH